MSTDLVVEKFKWLMKNDKKLISRDTNKIQEILDLISNGSDLNDIVQKDLGPVLLCYLQRYCNIIYKIIDGDDEDFYMIFMKKFVIVKMRLM